MLYVVLVSYRDESLHTQKKVFGLFNSKDEANIFGIKHLLSYPENDYDVYELQNKDLFDKCSIK